ncbi:MAG: transposase [bacterium]
MTNKPRQYHDGFWYHVYARCIDGLRLFQSDDEREWFLQKLDKIFNRRKLSLGALCLMDTHYHALVQMGPVRLDKALNGLHSSYATYLNETRPREGTLFWGRPGADIVLDDAYLLQLVPYIHQNPVEAEIVSDPKKYHWHTDEYYRNGSWSRFTFDSWKFPPHFEDSDRARVYREKMGESVEDLPGETGYIGSKNEWRDLEKRDEDRKQRHRDRRGRKSLEELGRRVAEENDTSLEALKAPGRSQPEARVRQEAMVLMYREGYGPTEIGDFFNRDKGAVVYAVQTSEE